jgi:hypothetical protein
MANIGRPMSEKFWFSLRQQNKKHLVESLSLIQLKKNHNVEKLLLSKCEER